jgi:hypothetical protein
MFTYARITFAFTNTHDPRYHLFDTTALMVLATLCSKRANPPSPSLFEYTTPDGRGLELVLDWLGPFAAISPARPWPFEQIRPFPEAPNQFATVFRMAANARGWARATVGYEAIAQAQLAAANGSAWQLELTVPPTF